MWTVAAAGVLALLIAQTGSCSPETQPSPAPAPAGASAQPSADVSPRRTASASGRGGSHQPRHPVVAAFARTAGCSPRNGGRVLILDLAARSLRSR